MLIFLKVFYYIIGFQYYKYAFDFWFLASGFWQSLSQSVIADSIRNLLKPGEGC